MNLNTGYVKEMYLALNQSIREFYFRMFCAFHCSRSYSRINYLDPEHVGDLSEAAGFNSLVAESAFCAMINTNIVPKVGQGIGSPS